MDALAGLFPNLSLGFSIALTPENLAYCFTGVLVGTVIGVLPGIGPLAAIAMLMPLTFKLNPIAAIIMLSGIYYGTKYGGSTTAIMLKLPGESASVVTCLDGYEMAKQGRAGPALGMAAVASFIAGSIGTILIGMFGPPLAEVALLFGAPEYFSLMLFSLIGAAVLVQGSMVNALGMIALGLLFGIVGTDINSGTSRFTFGVTGLADGINFVVIAMGLFGFAEIAANLEQSSLNRDLLFQKVKNLWPTWKDFRQSWNSMMRGTAIGAFFGILPGAGPTIASFSAYTLEKKVSKNREQFGKGAIEGVASPEAANNSASQCEFIPTLALGVPGSATMALVLGALMIHGIAPGPQVMTQRPDLFWGLIASMWIGNAMLLVLNLPLIGIWVKLLTVPYRILFPAIMVFMAIGVYSVANNPFDLVIMAVFGLFGLACVKLGMEPAPLALGVVLGPLMEENLRRAMLLARGDPTVFLTRPISAGFILAAVLVLVLLSLPVLRRKREAVFAEQTS